MYGKPEKTSSRVPSIRPFAAATRKAFQLGATIVEDLRHSGGSVRIILLNVENNTCRDPARRELSSAGALWPQNLLDLRPDFAALYKFPRSAAANPRFTASMKWLSCSR